VSMPFRQGSGSLVKKKDGRRISGKIRHKEVTFPTFSADEKPCRQGKRWGRIQMSSGSDLRSGDGNGRLEISGRVSSTEEKLV
jgi:hypothetical protein